MHKSTKETQKKRRLNHHIAPHHKEPVAAITVAFLLLALSALFAVGLIITKDFVQTAAKPSEQTNNKALEITPPPKLTAVINKVSYSNGDEAFQPSPNQRFIILDVDITHHLKTPIWLSPLLQSYVQDTQNNHYTLSPITLSNPFDARLYQIDEHATGQLSYLIPKEEKSLRWCYEISDQKLKVCSEINK